MESKKCTKCGKVLPFASFYKDRSRKDGLTTRCKECAKDQAKRYQESNPEKYNAYRKQYRKKNPEIFRETWRRWARNNPEKAKESSRRWRKDNPEKERANHRRRRERKRNAPGSCTVEQLQARFDYHDNRCVYCGSTDSLTVEHLIPLAKGGSGHPANLAPACLSCNSSKSDRLTFVEFRAIKQAEIAATSACS